QNRLPRHLKFDSPRLDACKNSPMVSVADRRWVRHANQLALRRKTVTFRKPRAVQNPLFRQQFVNLALVPRTRSCMPMPQVRCELRFKGALESSICLCPFDSEVRVERVARYGKLRNRDTS